MNLIELAQSAEALVQAQPPVVIEAQRCQHAKNKASSCDLCVQACPTNAIALENHAPVVTASDCIRCGLCLSNCPAGVFDAYDPTYNLLYCATQLHEKHAVEITCKHHPDASHGDAGMDAVIQTSRCLAAYGLSTYLGLLALGVEQIRVRLDACHACPLRLLEPHARHTTARANAIATPGAGPDRVVVVDRGEAAEWVARPVYSEKNPTLSRRSFFRLLSLQAEDDLHRLAQRDEPQVAGLISAPRDRRRQMRALRVLAQSQPDRVVMDDELVVLEANDRCTACEVCANVCPTGAISIHKEDDYYALSFVPADCTRCGLCLEICEPEALRNERSPLLSELVREQPLILRSGALQRCTKCHATYAGPGENGLCSFCATRRRNPFGLNLPETLLKTLPDGVRARLEASTKAGD